MTQEIYINSKYMKTLQIKTFQEETMFSKKSFVGAMVLAAAVVFSGCVDNQIPEETGLNNIPGAAGDPRNAGMSTGDTLGFDAVPGEDGWAAGADEGSIAGGALHDAGWPVVEGIEFPIIYFDFDRDEIRPSEREAIQQVANYMNTYPELGLIIEGHTDDVTSVCISPDEKYLYSCSLDSTVRQWDMAKGICVDTIKFTNHLNSIAMRSDGTGIAVAGYGYTYLYAIPDGEIHTLSHYGRALIEDLCFSPDGKYLVVASQGAIQLWDVSETPTPCDTFSEDCYACCFSKDGNLLYTGHYKGEIRVWSMDELLEKGSTAFLLEACKSHLKEKEIALTDRFKEKWKLK